MSNDTTPETPDTVDQEALEAEATTGDSGFDVEFDGYTYRVLDGQPSPKAMGYIADYFDNENGLFAVLFVKEMIGKSAWEEWCTRHKTDQILDMMTALNEGYAGNSSASHSG